MRKKILLPCKCFTKYNRLFNLYHSVLCDVFFLFLPPFSPPLRRTDDASSSRIHARLGEIRRSLLFLSPLFLFFVPSFSSFAIFSIREVGWLIRRAEGSPVSPPAWSRRALKNARRARPGPDNVLSRRARTKWKVEWAAPTRDHDLGDALRNPIRSRDNAVRVKGSFRLTHSPSRRNLGLMYFASPWIVKRRVIVDTSLNSAVCFCFVSVLFIF